MSSLQTEADNAAQMCTGAERPTTLTETNPSDQSLSPKDNATSAEQADRAGKICGHDDLATEWAETRKERKRSVGQEKTEDQETTERQEEAEKKDRSKSRSKSRKGRKLSMKQEKTEDQEITEKQEKAEKRDRSKSRSKSRKGRKLSVEQEKTEDPETTGKQKEAEKKDRSKSRSKSRKERKLSMEQEKTEDPETTEKQKKIEKKDRSKSRSKSRKERKLSMEQEKTEDQETTERKEEADKRGRSKTRSRPRNEPVDGGVRAEEGGIVSEQISRSSSVPVSSHRTPSRGLSRSKSPVSRVRQKTLEVSKDDERGRYFEKAMSESFRSTPAPKVVTKKNLLTESKPTEQMTQWYHQGAPLLRNIGRAAKIVYEGASFALGLFVIHFLKHVVMFFVLMSLISGTHRAICEIPLVKYYHSPCAAVWMPMPPPIDAQQNQTLNQLVEPMERQTEFLNQLQTNEYFETIPMALFQSSSLIRRMKAQLWSPLQDSPSLNATMESLEKFAAQAEETGEKISKMSALLESTVDFTLGLRKGAVNELERIHSESSDTGVLAAISDIPGLLWSFFGTPLLGRRVLTPFQARQLDKEQLQLHYLRHHFLILQIRLNDLSELIESARDDFDKLNENIHKIQSYFVLNISQISHSRDLLTVAAAHPYERLRALFGFRGAERYDTYTLEAKLEILTASNATIIMTTHELIMMTDVVRKLQNDVKSVVLFLDQYRGAVHRGEMPVDGLLQAVKVGVEALARARAAYEERERRRHQSVMKEAREASEWARAEVNRFKPRGKSDH